jgi:hypothetical protein
MPSKGKSGDKPAETKSAPQEPTTAPAAVDPNDAPAAPETPPEGTPDVLRSSETGPRPVSVATPPVVGVTRLREWPKSVKPVKSKK